MDTIFEFLFTLLFEGWIELILNKKINIKIRKFLLFTITLFYLGLSLCFAILLFKVDIILAKIVLGFVIALYFIAIIKFWRKIYKKKFFS